LAIPKAKVAIFRQTEKIRPFFFSENGNISTYFTGLIPDPRGDRPLGANKI
jgi:hypothetical protein